MPAQTAVERNAMEKDAILDPSALSRMIDAPYHNRSLGRANDHEVRLSVMTEAFDWHFHPDSDEAFLAVEGGLIIEFEDRLVELMPGQILIVPKSVLHRTRPVGARSVNLTFEKAEAATIFRDAPAPGSTTG
jgi:mannose-6-phosphate isomerase-like protein (cupin superfamily)